MRDQSLILTDNSLSATAFAANALLMNKTSVEGHWLMFVITKTGADADERLDIDIHAKDTDSGWATTDDRVATVPQVGSGVAQNAIVVRYAKLNTDKKYSKPRYVLSGTTPGFSIECSVVSGPAQDTTV